MFILGLCAFALIMTMTSGERDMEQTDRLLNRSYQTIVHIEQISTKVETILSVQRGYLLSQEQHFLDKYQEQKERLSDLLAELAVLVDGYPDQESRLDEMRNYITEFTTRLEERKEDATLEGIVRTLDDVSIVNSLRADIRRLNTAMLDVEYQHLNQQFQNLDQIKDQYYKTLIVGIFFASILLVLLNAFLLNAQRKRTRAETSLKGVEERFALAVEGTQDGIFDWDFATGEVYYSKRFFAMLGEDRDGYTGTKEDSQERIHEDDLQSVLQHMREYLAGKEPSFTHEFRMKHASGRWIWVQCRAKAIYDKSGRAIRMVGAYTDITPIVQSKEKLEVEKRRALEANEAKSQFLAHMSHEIRTPLTAISGIAEILDKQKDTLSEKNQKLIKTLNNSTTSLKDLVNDVLDFSKIEREEIELEQATIDLEALFEQTISMMSVKAQEKGISFVFDYEAVKGLPFTGDVHRLRQILVNLIGNAIKFTEEGGVTIHASFDERAGDSYLRVDVADTGIGVAPENFDVIFDRFKQADSSVSRKFGGTGLGLPISRKLAVLMGGDIFLTSEFGKGSTFTLSLPGGGKAVAPETKTNNNPQELEDLDKELQSLSVGKKVLIVEDYHGNVVLISHMLEELGIYYDVAENGQEAVNFWNDCDYDLILMDIQMPIMDGITATHTIREQESENSKRAYTPIIGMSAHALSGDDKKGIKAGMDTYLTKPIIEIEFKRALAKHIDSEKRAAA